MKVIWQGRGWQRERERERGCLPLSSARGNERLTVFQFSTDDKSMERFQLRTIDVSG